MLEVLSLRLKRLHPVGRSGSKSVKRKAASQFMTRISSAIRLFVKEILRERAFYGGIFIYCEIQQVLYTALRRHNTEKIKPVSSASNTVAAVFLLLSRFSFPQANT